MKRILITGANGQLGNEMQTLAPEAPMFEFIFTDVAELDITDAQTVQAFVADNAVDYIVNCAAYTAVDKAEENPDLCRLLNATAVKNLGVAAQKVGAKVIHVSTDYVFNGKGYQPYTEEMAIAPQSIYGETKAEGEKRLMEACPHSIIIRTAWLYSPFGNNFVKTMIRLGKERATLNVVFDQVGTPTYAADLAEAILAIINYAEQDRFVPGIYHYSNEGVCSWYDFTLAIHKLRGITSCNVSPIETSDYPTPAARPHYSVLNKRKIKSIFGITIPHWEDSLARCLARL